MRYILLLPLCLMGCKEKEPPFIVVPGGGKITISTNDPASGCKHAYKQWEEWKPNGYTCSFYQTRHCETCNATQLRWVQGQAFVQP